MAQVESVRHEGANIHFTLRSAISHELKIDQSVAHDGCCLTVVETSAERYTVTAIHETLQKTNLSAWSPGTLVNIERCTQMNGRLDGHIVQGHVDEVGEVLEILDADGSYLITIGYQTDSPHITVPQGSITVNGVSLTVARSAELESDFSVAIIPYTWEHTNLRFLKPGSLVNLEFDIIGKYISKLLAKRHAAQ